MTADPALGDYLRRTAGGPYVSSNIALAAFLSSLANSAWRATFSRLPWASAARNWLLDHAFLPSPSIARSGHQSWSADRSEATCGDQCMGPRYAQAMRRAMDRFAPALLAAKLSGHYASGVGAGTSQPVLTGAAATGLGVNDRASSRGGDRMFYGRSLTRCLQPMCLLSSRT
jgi:hypothetical protein